MRTLCIGVKHENLAKQAANSKILASLQKSADIEYQ
jgi:hypothetical protein